MTLLEQYNDVMFWLKDGFIEEAKEKYEKITDYEDTAMESAFEELEKAIEDEAEKIEDEIENVQNLLDEKRFSEAEREADALLDDRHLTDEQIERVVDLWSEAVAGQKKTSPSPKKTTAPTEAPSPTYVPGISPNVIPTQYDESEPPVHITIEQAREIARQVMDLPENATITVTQHGEYYIVNAEVDYGDFVDECGCHISVYDGQVFNLAG